MILCKQDLEDAVSDFEDGILDPAFDGDNGDGVWRGDYDDSFMSDEDYEAIYGWGMQG